MKKTIFLIILMSFIMVGNVLGEDAELILSDPPICVEGAEDPSFACVDSFFDIFVEVSGHEGGDTGYEVKVTDPESNEEVSETLIFTENGTQKADFDPTELIRGYLPDSEGVHTAELRTQAHVVLRSCQFNAKPASDPTCSGSGNGVPEFSTIGVIIALIAIALGIFIHKKRN